MYIWNEFYKGVGSPEWLMGQIGRFGQKKGKTVKKEVLLIAPYKYSPKIEEIKQIEIHGNKGVIGEGEIIMKCRTELNKSPTSFP
ncbi:unnamed protein product [marine sediment metagenome]|uniref:Uncharacterized protein n=1 Tax=marine sediment metagenome TaxID=412755 RepID=X1DM94_9ZZZZ